MSENNRFMGPVQDQYTQTYVSQYVPLPFEIMQKKADAEQKQFDAVSNNWDVISSKMGEKVLAADKDIMTEQVNSYSNDINKALEAAGGDWRKLSRTVTGVAANYKEFMTNGEGGDAVSRLAEMTQKKADIKDSELSGRMKRLQTNYLDYEYNKNGGIRGNANNPDGNTSIREPILYDESKLKESLVGFIDKLKPNKGDKIQAYKDKDGSIKYAAVGAMKTYRSDELGMLVSTGKTEKGVGLDRVRTIAQGVYEDVVFKDKIAAEMMVGMHKGHSVPVKNADGTMSYEKRDLTESEYKQMIFAKEFGFTDAYAYMQEETKYTLKTDEQAKAKAAKKAAQAKIKAEQGVITHGTNEIEGSSNYSKNNKKSDDLLEKLEKETVSGNKSLVQDYTENGAVYNSFKNNFKNQDPKNTVPDSERRKDYENRWLNLFNSDPELKDLVNIKADGVTNEISDEGFNHLFKKINTGDDDIVNSMMYYYKDENGEQQINPNGIFYNEKDAKQFKKLAKERDNKTYLNEQRLKENKNSVYRTGNVLPEGSLNTLRTEVEADKQEYIDISKGFIEHGFKEKTVNDININTKQNYTQAEADEKNKNNRDAQDWLISYQSTSVGGKWGGQATTSVGTRTDLYPINKMLGDVRSMFYTAGREEDEKDQINGENFELEFNQYKLKNLNVRATTEFITNLGDGDLNTGYSRLRSYMIGTNKKRKDYSVKKQNFLDMEKRLEEDTKLFEESLEKKLEKKSVLQLNNSNALSLESVQEDGTVIKSQLFAKDFVKNLPISNILSSSLHTSLDGDKATPASVLPKGSKAGTEKEQMEVLRLAMLDGQFSDDINPNTNQTEFVFTLGGKDFRIPYAVGSKAPTGGYAVEPLQAGAVVSKKDLIEREIRLDLHKARMNSLERTPLGNYRDGVTIRTKEPGFDKPFNKNFNFNFSDGGGYKLTIDPTAVGINMKLDDKTTRKEMNLSGTDAVKFMKVYKNIQKFDDLSESAMAAFVKKFPKYKGMNARQATREFVRQAVYKEYETSRPANYVAPADIAPDSFRNGRRYSGGRQGLNYSQGRMYSYPDGFNPGEEEVPMSAQQNDSIINGDLDMFKSYGDSVSKSRETIVDPEVESTINNYERTPYPFGDMTGGTTSAPSDTTATAAVEVQDPSSTSSIPFNEAPAFDPTQFNTTGRRYVNQEGNIEDQEFKPLELDSLNKEELNLLQKDTDSTISDSGIVSQNILDIDSSSVKGGEDAFTNVRKDPKVDAKLNSLGITGDVTSESLATDFSNTNTENFLSSDADTQEEFYGDGTDYDAEIERLIGINRLSPMPTLPGELEKLEKKKAFFENMEQPANFAKELKADGTPTGVIRKQNLKDFAEKNNAGDIVKAMSLFSSDTYYNNGSKVTDDMELKDVEKVDCSSFAHITLAQSGYDMKGSSHKPVEGSKYQLDKNGLSPYSGGLYHNSVNSKKKEYQGIDKIDYSSFKDGQVICFDTGYANWEQSWRQTGNAVGIDHIGVVTMIDGVPYIGESSSSKNKKGPALMKLEDRLQELKGKLNTKQYELTHKRDKSGKKIPLMVNALDDSGNKTYKITKGKDGKEIKTAIMKRVKGSYETKFKLDAAGKKIRKSTVYIGEYNKKK